MLHSWLGEQCIWEQPWLWVRSRGTPSSSELETFKHTSWDDSLRRLLIKHEARNGAIQTNREPGTWETTGYMNLSKSNIDIQVTEGTFQLQVGEKRAYAGKKITRSVLNGAIPAEFAASESSAAGERKAVGWEGIQAAHHSHWTSWAPSMSGSRLVWKVWPHSSPPSMGRKELVNIGTLPNNWNKSPHQQTNILSRP